MIVILLIAYLIGSIPFGFILTKIMGAGDIRSSGSGNIGATNVMRVLGKKAGYVTFLLDSAKGIIALLICGNLATDLMGLSGQMMAGATANFQHYYMVGIAAIVGHCFPLWLKFKGGKGVSTALGIVVYTQMMLAPQLWWVLLLITSVWIVIFRISRMVSLASIAVFIAIFIANYLIFNEILYSSVLSGLVIFRHKSNIIRLLNGTESRFNKK